jgi:hypothetical protein
MQDDILLSTAYFPPAGYFHLIKTAGNVFIEQMENYPRQTYRNRCRILSSGGTLDLSVPVTKGGLRKVLTRDVTIDYTKKWQNIHLRALTSAYNRSPYFQFYFDFFEPVIRKNHKYLIDLNAELLDTCLGLLKIIKCINYTSYFIPETEAENDHRYRISPKIRSGFHGRPYIQVFGVNGFIPDLSVLDLIFNTGPEAVEYL